MASIVDKETLPTSTIFFYIECQTYNIILSKCVDRFICNFRKTPHSKPGESPGRATASSGLSCSGTIR